MAKKKEEKQKFGDIIENHDLIKRTLMVAAFPGLIKETNENGKVNYHGFLPGFEFAETDTADENECVEQLQDMLDDEVEELVVFGKSLPDVAEDDELLKTYPGYKIVYLDINVYATAEELRYYDECKHDCSCCDHDCGCEDEDMYEDYCEDDCCCDDDCDCEDDCDCDDDCEDDHCTCGHEHHHDHHCDCEDGHEHKHKNKK